MRVDLKRSYTKLIQIYPKEHVRKSMIELEI